MTDKIQNEMSLEDRTDKFIRFRKVIANTVLGVATGIATIVEPNYPFFLQLGTIGGYNVSCPPKSKSFGRNVGELVAYTGYAFSVKYASNEIIQYASSLINNL